MNKFQQGIAVAQPHYQFFGGYLKVHYVLNRAFNIVLSLLLIIINLPFFIILPIIIKLQDGQEVFYRGIRLGKGKKPYEMYKFRTLTPDAEQQIGKDLLSAKHNLVTPFGKFLRDTRLDELPQLFNILRGDMDFVGPRPERPIIYEKICRHIRGYDLRFAVRPGLVGYSQLFTPHSSPKQFRTLIDNRFMKKSQSFSGELTILFYTGIILTRTLFLRFVNLLTTAWKRISGDKERRQLERIAPQNAMVLIYSSEGGGSLFLETELVDINEDYFLVHSDKEIISKDFHARLQITFESGVLKKRIKIKTAKCSSRVYLQKQMKGSGRNYSYVMEYKPASPLNFYMVHQYFLNESVA